MRKQIIEENTDRARFNILGPMKNVKYVPLVICIFEQFSNLDLENKALLYTSKSGLSDSSKLGDSNRFQYINWGKIINVLCFAESIIVFRMNTGPFCATSKIVLLFLIFAFIKLFGFF